MSGESHDAVSYLQVEPTFRTYYGEQSVSAIKVVAQTQSRPRKPRAGAVLVKVTLRIPDAAFLPLQPEAIVIVPESMTIASPIEVEAGDPS